MQPLDVGVCQPYEHWHDMAIQDTLEEFSTEYTMSRFLGDLTKIRDETFKPSTIQHALEKSGIYTPNASKYPRGPSSPERLLTGPFVNHSHRYFANIGNRSDALADILTSDGALMFDNIQTEAHRSAQNLCT